jgi:Zn-dependent protease with chaperone function
MAEMSFDFQRYIAERSGADESAAQSGRAYAYPGDQKILRTLARVTPVGLAAAATGRLWKSGAGRELLQSAIKLTEQGQPELHRAACLCAERLGLLLPAIYLVPDEAPPSYAFGTSEDAVVVLRRSLCETLRPEELRFFLGHELGRVQNGHTVYMTAIHYLGVAASQYLRWIVKPAVAALRSWARRAEVTADRAGLICSGDLDASVAALGRLEPPDLDAHVEALKLFSETHYFLKASGRKPREDEGKSLAWCDERTKKLLSRAGE